MDLKLVFPKHRTLLKICTHMERRYYLSKFVGDGKTPETAFKAKISQYGTKWNMIDYRQDPSKKDGWCFACLDLDDHEQVEKDPDVIPLGIDPHSELPGRVRVKLMEVLGESFSSRTLTDIIAELLLRRGMIRPSPDGRHQIWLGSLLRELSAEEAIAVIGRSILTCSSKPKQKAAAHSSSSPRRELKGPLEEALETVSRLADYREPGWLSRELIAVSEKRSCHPLAVSYREAQEALAAGEEAIWASHASHWIMMLAHDVSILADLLNLKTLASRVRSSHDCEPTKYELYVMAGYKESGATIEKTDQDKTGEFRIKWQDPWTYVECKQKSALSLKDRLRMELYERGTKELQALMLKLSVFAHIHITCRTDPSEEDLAEILRAVAQGLQRPLGTGIRYKKGKLEIVFLPSSAAEGVTDGSLTGLKLPKGFEYGVTEGRVASIHEGRPILDKVWGVAWRSQEPSDWVKSSIESFKKAADQLPESGPGLVFLDLPEGMEEVVIGRLAILYAAIEPVLATRKRVNAVVLTGRSLVTEEPDSNVAITRVRYKVLRQKEPRTPLPEDFKVLGDDFTRRPT